MAEGSMVKTWLTTFHVHWIEKLFQYNIVIRKLFKIFAKLLLEIYIFIKYLRKCN